MNLIELNNYLNPLTKQYEGYTQTIETLDAKLNDYRAELATLKNKYDVTAIEKEISKNNLQKNKTKNKIMTIKYRYIAKLIYDKICYREDGVFNRNDKNASFFKWLYETFKIKYKREWNFIDYETFYVDYIQEHKDIDEDLDLEFNHDSDSFSVEAEYYFRHELDDRVELIIPTIVLNNLEEFEDSVNSYFKELKIKAEEETNQKAIEAEKKEYEQYLKLKEKYENN